MKNNILYLNLGFFDYDKVIIEEMKKQNYKVESYCLVKKLSTNELLMNRLFKNYEKKNLEGFFKQFFSYIDNCESEFDIIFVIGFSHFDTMFANRIKERYPHARIILYYWDDLERACPDKHVLDIADKVCSFDRKDAMKYNLNFRPLFYADSFIGKNEFNRKYDLSFIGTLHSDRAYIIEELLDFMNRENLYKFYSLHMDKLRYIYRKLRYSKNIVPYLTTDSMSLSEIADIIKNSKASLDIQYFTQKGLTMRTIECVGAETKIITTNSDIVHYDFYCPDNIMVIDRAKPKLDLDFLNKPYKPINESIYKTYSIQSWIKDVLK
ncbi:MAG: hypothetical protein NC300_04050 [Bacteroidales bacterium]|nr:hypothetical protein [Clostridium sp.]MCM1203294.1 hypothetical protein [Bacteroidales bacterium]